MGLELCAKFIKNPIAEYLEFHEPAFLGREGVYAPGRPPFLPHARQRVSYSMGLMALRLAFLWDMNKKKCCNGFDIQFRQNFAKETLSYDEYLKS